MQNKIIRHLLLVFTLIPVSLLAQNSGKLFFNQKPGQKEIPNEHNNSFSNTDYKVISSNESFLEIEFYPSFKASSEIIYNGETFYTLNFENGFSKDMRFAGEPDIKSRQFTIIIPSENNTVSIIDYDVKEISDINLSPVPGYTMADPNKKNFENLITSYSKDFKFYFQN